jgi:hypothetical protein
MPPKRERMHAQSIRREYRHPFGSAQISNDFLDGRLARVVGRRQAENRRYSGRQLGQ